MDLSLLPSNICISQTPGVQCVRAQPGLATGALKSPTRRDFGVRLFLASVTMSPGFQSLSVASELDSSQVPRKDDPESWDEYVGDGYAMKIPPGFEDTSEPDEYPVGDAPLYGYRPKAKVFSAQFASADRKEFLSVIIRRSSQLKPTFFEAKSITDLGKIDDIAKLFLPVGASLAATASITDDKRVYYLYEYLVGMKHVFLSATAKSGQIYIAAATAPQAKWKVDGPMLRSAAASFSVL